MLIKDASNPTPFFTRKEPPIFFKTETDRLRYWEKEKKIWLDGYSDDVNGMLYFYATQCILKDRISAKLYYPTVRDADVLIFKHIEQAMKDGKAPFIIKGRGIGFSSIGMNLPFYFWKTNPGATCVATSKDKGTLATLFTEKTMIAYDEMHPDIKPSLVRKNQTLAESYLKTGTNYKDDKGNVKYAESVFLCRDTQESEKAATKFSGAGSIYGFSDESPLMPRLFTFFNSAIEIFKDHANNRIAGLLLMGGTVEDTIPKEAIRRISDIFAKADAMNIAPYFISAVYGKHVTNGHSDTKRAEEEILKRREELDKLDDKSFLNAYIKNNPLSIDEIFELNTGGRFDEYTISVVNKQLKALHSEQKYIPIPHIIVPTVTGLEAELDKKSNIKILEHPKPNVDYIFGYDGIMTSELTSDNKGSKMAFIGMKGLDPQSELQFCPVAMYLERPKTIEYGNEQSVLLLKYFNKFGRAKAIGELNAAGEHFIQMAQNQALKQAIMFRKDLNKTGWVDTKKMWFYRVDKILDWQIEHGNIYFKKYGHMVYFKEMLEDALKGLDENTDALDALLACIYGYGTGDIFGEKPKIKIEQPKQLTRTFVLENGQVLEKWI